MRAGHQPAEQGGWLPLSASQWDECRRHLIAEACERYGYRRAALDDVEDLVQDAFLRGFKRAATFRGDGYQTQRRWLKAILHRLAIDRFRRQQAAPPRSPLLVDNLRDGSPPPLERLIAAEDSNRLSAMLARLPHSDREIVQTSGHALVQLAKRLGITFAALRQRRIRLIRQIKHDLNNGGGRTAPGNNG